ncbi:MAG: hypothetical protein HQL26_04185 [Candidatus Omnitrophica bacterium]|nr:hypothetical protein [Candidatus Omnitrophota bacterium]
MRGLNRTLLIVSLGFAFTLSARIVFAAGPAAKTSTSAVADLTPAGVVQPQDSSIEKTTLPALAPALINKEKTLREEKTEDGFVVNIKDLIKRSKAKIEKVNVKLEEQAKFRRNQQREEKAREYYQKAMQFYEDGKYDQAREYWDKAIKITEHPEMKGYIGISSSRFKKQEKVLAEEENTRIKQLEQERGFSAKEVDKVYEAAVKLFQQAKYLPAKEQFESVEEMFPDYKAARSYLMVIDQEIQKDQAQIIEKKLKDQTDAARKKKEEWRKKIDSEEKDRQHKSVVQAEKFYTEAIRLYKIGQYTQALERFKEVEWIVPDYKFTQRYLAKLNAQGPQDGKILTNDEKVTFFSKQVREERLDDKQEEATKEKQEALTDEKTQKRIYDEAQFIYEGAVALFNLQQYTKAKIQFDSVEAIAPEYKATRSFLKKIQDWEDKESLRTNGEEIKKLYIEALRFYDQKKYALAQEKFLQVKELYSNYKATNNYLNLISKATGVPVPVKPEYSLKKARYEPNLPEVKTNKAVGQNKKALKGGKGLEVSPVLTGAQAENMFVQKAIEERKLKFTEEAETKYQLALKFFKENNFSESKRKFIQVEAVYPNYKDTADYLKKIDEESNQFQPEVNKGAWEKNKFEQGVKAKIPLAIQKEIDEIYTTAVSLFDNKNYPLARTRFNQVERLSPQYKQTAKYLKKIDDTIGKEKGVKPVINQNYPVPPVASSSHSISEHDDFTNVDSQSLNKVYQHGIDLYRAKQYERSKKIFEDVNTMKPNYRDTEKYLLKIDKLLEKQKKYIEKARPGENPVVLPPVSVPTSAPSVLSEPQVAQSLNDKDIENMYFEAVSLYKAQEYEIAREKFNLVEFKSPGYRSSQRYLELIKVALEQQKVKNQIVENKRGSLETSEVMDSDKLCDKYFDQAVEFYNASQFVQAKRKFYLAKATVPGRHKNIDEYISKINQAIRAEAQQINEAKTKATEEHRLDREQLDGYVSGSVAQIASLKAKENAREHIRDMQYAQFRKEIDAKERNNGQVAKLRSKEENRLTKALERDILTNAVPDMAEPPELIEEDMSVELDALTEFCAEQQLAIAENEREAVHLVEEAKKTAEVEKIVPARKEEVVNSPSSQISKSQPQDSGNQVTQSEIRRAEAHDRSEERRRLAVELEIYKKKQIETEANQQRILRQEKSKVNSLLEKTDFVELKRWQKDAGVLYREAMSAYNAGDYRSARIKFNSVEKIYPGYKSASKMIRRCDDVLKAVEADEKYKTQEIITKPVSRPEVKKVVPLKPSGMASFAETKMAASEPTVADQSDAVKMAVVQNNLQNDVRQEFDEVVDSVNEQKLELASKKINETEKMLANPSLDKRFVHSIRGKLAAQKIKLSEAVNMGKAPIAKHAEEKVDLQKDLQANVTDAYNDLLSYVDQKDVRLAEKKVGVLNALLADGNLDHKFTVNMQRKVDQQSRQIRKIVKEANKTRINEYTAKARKEDKNNQGRIDKEDQDLDRLEKQINHEETQLQKDRDSLRQLEQSVNLKDVKIQKSNEALAAGEPKAKREDIQNQNNLQDAQDQRDQLLDLMKKRQQEIDVDRKQVQMDLSSQLDRMYQRALDLNSKGNTAESRRIFSAIREIDPTFKDVGKYLK